METTHEATDETDGDGRVRRALAGDPEAWGAVLAEHRERLRRMVAVRLDRRIWGRVDPSDVIQEAFLEASERRPDYARNPTLPFFLWLRLLVGQRLQMIHRRHLGAQVRDAAREISLDGGAWPEATSVALAAQLLGHDTRASEAFQRAERALRVRQALDRLDPDDREVLALRHFEQLSYAECAVVLRTTEAAATKRHFRALGRLKAALRALGVDLEELRP
jgi:RNA polymerase sigma-70 factor (ECF subfamily)